MIDFAQIRLGLLKNCLSFLEQLNFDHFAGIIDLQAALEKLIDFIRGEKILIVPDGALDEAPVEQSLALGYGLVLLDF